MEVIICIKQVPDTTGTKLGPVKSTLIHDGVPSIMNPDDKGTLKQILLLKDQFGTEVSVITTGPSQATVILHETLAMDCDRGYLIIGRRFGGADTPAASYTISQALKMIDYDIVLAGRQAIDGDITQIGPQIAEQLDLPQITYVEHIDYDGKKTLTAMRNVEEGHETLEVDVPCMLTFLASAYEPRYVNIPDIMTAFDKEITMLIADNFPVEEERLGLKDSPTHVKKSFTKDTRTMGALYEDMTPEEATDLTIEKLKEKFII